jgi:hypothetical protein
LPPWSSAAGNWTKRLHIAGVLLNNIATPRQESVIREAVEQYTGIPVVGIGSQAEKGYFSHAPSRGYSPSGDGIGERRR